MIEIINVTKEIKGKKVLKNINLKFKKKEMILLKGHNGCGKTMLLRLIAGFIKPSTGTIKGIENCSFGVIIENPSFFLNETALYNLKYLAKIKNIISDEDIFESLKIFDLYDVRNNKVKTFSLGMKQRLALCQAFMENPDILLLDEPFNAIDDENLTRVIKLLNNFKEKGKLIIIASHGDVKGCKFNRIIKMREGEIIN